MITATTWVPRGFAAQFPERAKFDEAEFERIANMARLKLEDAQEELEEAQAEEDVAMDEDNKSDDEKTKEDKTGAEKSDKKQKKEKQKETMKDADSDEEYVFQAFYSFQLEFEY